MESVRDEGMRFVLEEGGTQTVRLNAGRRRVTTWFAGAERP